MTTRYPLVLNGTTIQETQAGDGIQLPTALDIAYGGTGQTTANAAFNALAPSQIGNTGKYLTTDGTNTSWATNPLGTVTSVAMTTPIGLTVSGSPITSSGTLAVDLQTGYSIPTTANQTNWNTAYSERQQWDGGATNLVAATGRTSLGLGTIATQAASSVAITGGSITGITDLAVADGGTGASTAQAAMNTFAGAVTSGSYLRGNGTNVVMSTIQAADVPTLNQNTTGSSGSCTGNAATATTATTATTANALNTANNYQVNSLGVGTAGSGTAGEIRATNNITAYYSDDRLKTKLGNIEDALAKIKTLSGFYYEANETAQALGYDVIREVGVSAQQVQAVMPETVAPAPIDEKYLTVRYERLVPLLIEAIKELDAKIDSLKGA